MYGRVLRGVSCFFAMDSPGGSYSAALGGTSTTNDHTHEYVEIDTTFYNDCRHLPTTAAVCLGIKRVFGEDEDVLDMLTYQTEWKSHKQAWRMGFHRC